MRGVKGIEMWVILLGMNHGAIGRRWLRRRELQVGLSALLLMQASISVIFTPVLLAQQKPASSKTSSKEEYRDAEAYKIYSALLKAHSDSPFVIEAKTLFFDEAAPDNLDVKGESRFRELWGTVLEDFAVKYRTPMSLTESIPLAAPYVLVSEETISGIFGNGDDWYTFRERYPHADGIYNFSPVGFDERKTRAMVWMQFTCGKRCFFGTYHFFRKSGGKWREVKVEAQVRLLGSPTDSVK